MEKKEYKIHQKDRGVRLDQYLVDAFGRKYSRSYIQKLIAEKLVLVDNNPAKRHHNLREDEKITVFLKPESSSQPAPEKINLDIVYEDNSILVVNKPSRMIVHPSPGKISGTLVNALLYHCGNLSDIAGEFKPGIVHRLDKDTSGLLVVAKNNEAHQELASQFKKRKVKREYSVLVHGVVQFDEGLIDAPIGRSSKIRQKMTVDYLSKKDASTFYKVIDRYKNTTLLELKLITGRTHQIRVHLKHIGYPVIGDSQYGLKKDAIRQMLHAKTLGFIHPETKKYVEFNSHTPKDMQSYIEKLSK